MFGVCCVLFKCGVITKPISTGVLLYVCVCNSAIKHKLR